MTLGISSYLANQWLDALGNADAFSVSTVYMKLHVGDPGGAGTSNAATETSRKPVSFSAAASGAITNDAAITWVSVAGSEDFTHYSLWDASSGGNFLHSGTLTSAPVTTGDAYLIAAGDLDITCSTLAA